MKKYSYLLVFTLLAFACYNDDDSTQNNEPSLFGEWSLINVSGGLIGVDQDFDSDLIIWDFNQDTMQLTITNNNTDADFDGWPTGVYNYTVSSTDDGLTIVIENFSMTVVTLTSTSLTLDEGIAVDGFLFKFNR
ncbi:hypothetical protein [uncultured Psychroserpens sp.]|uniref:hypothetical protein n=1 Tax=uncultured Psychroserpens sp. TaxID=255436 RepID=UPI002622BCD1|nr:hypothetical protein [uncultured Psychroserpens sp.]